MPRNPNTRHFVASGDVEKLSCTSCVWFEPMNNKSTGHGLCRLNPPVVIPRIESNQVGNMQQMMTKAHTSFPYVRESDWCGEHEPDVSL